MCFSPAAPASILASPLQFGRPTPGRVRVLEKELSMARLFSTLTPRAALPVCAVAVGVLISTALAFAAKSTSPNQQLLDPTYLKPGSSRTFTIEYVGQV